MLTILGSFAIEVFKTFYSSVYSNNYEGYLIWTFHEFWEIGFFFICYFILKRFDVIFGDTIIFLFFGLVFSSITWSFYSKSFKYVQPNYYGVESRLNYNTHQEGRYDEQTNFDHKISQGCLYKANDPELLSELKEASRNNEYVGTRGFLFWQTGRAYGFIPIGIEEYNGGRSFLNHLELYFTIGPVLLFECFLTGLYTNFISLIFLQLIWFIWKKKFIWWS